VYLEKKTKVGGALGYFEEHIRDGEVSALGGGSLLSLDRINRHGMRRTKACWMNEEEDGPGGLKEQTMTLDARNQTS